MIISQNTKNAIQHSFTGDNLDSVRRLISNLTQVLNQRFARVVPVEGPAQAKREGARLQTPRSLLMAKTGRYSLPPIRSFGGQA